jgi:hypothetical protein
MEGTGVESFSPALAKSYRVGTVLFSTHIRMTGCSSGEVLFIKGRAAYGRCSVCTWPVRTLIDRQTWHKDDEDCMTLKRLSKSSIYS